MDEQEHLSIALESGGGVGAFFFPCMQKALIMLVVPFLLLAACKQEAVEEEIIGQEVIVTPMPTGGEVRDPDHGREAWFAVGPVEGTDKNPANGVATAHYFEDGTSILGLQVNIAPPEEGFFYEAWFPMGASSAGWVSLGHLQNPSGDVRHELRFEIQQDMRTQRSISITREPDDGNPEPGTIVATALLTTRQR